MNNFVIKTEKLFDKIDNIERKRIKNSVFFNINYTENGNSIIMYLDDFHVNIINIFSHKKIIIDDFVVEYFNSIVLFQKIIICSNGNNYNKMTILDLNLEIITDLKIKNTWFLCSADRNQILLVDLDQNRRKESYCFLCFDYNLKFIRFLGQSNFLERYNYFQPGLDINDIIIMDKIYIWFNNYGVFKINFVNCAKIFKNIPNILKIFNCNSKILILKKNNGNYYIETLNIDLIKEKEIQIPKIFNAYLNLKNLQFLKIFDEETFITYDKNKNIILKFIVEKEK